MIHTVDVLFPSSKHCLNMERIKLCCVTSSLHNSDSEDITNMLLFDSLVKSVFLWKQLNTKTEEGPENDLAGLKTLRKSQQKLAFLAFLTILDPLLSHCFLDALGFVNPFGFTQGSFNIYVTLAFSMSCDNDQNN